MDQLTLFGSPAVPCPSGGDCRDCGWCEGGLVLRGETTLAEISTYTQPLAGPRSSVTGRFSKPVF